MIHAFLAFALGCLATSSLWVWYQFLEERKKNKLARCAIGKLISDRDAACKIIHELETTVLKQQAIIEENAEGWKHSDN